MLIGGLLSVRELTEEFEDIKDSILYQFALGSLYLQERFDTNCHDGKKCLGF